jgi:predicted phosphodiesterase
LRFLVLSDIHANVHALEAVLEDAARRGHDETVVLGDLVGYGAYPTEVLETVAALGARAVVRGNHDKVCCGLEEPIGFNEDAVASAAWTRSVLTEEERLQLMELPPGPLSIGADFEICHGAPFDEDYYVFDRPDGERVIGAMSRPLCLFGHTHVPTAFALNGGQVVGVRLAPTIAIQRDGRACFNVGSVGQPRDGDWRAAYGIFDCARWSLELLRVEYDIAAAREQILRAGLPRWHADRLAIGR